MFKAVSCYTFDCLFSYKRISGLDDRLAALFKLAGGLGEFHLLV